MGLQFFSILATLIIFLNTLGNIHAKSEATETLNQRHGKQLSIFQVIRFNNGPCNGTQSMPGTCYTSQECSTRRGVSIGSCANGFGVCCSFTISCGGTTSENTTIFNDENIPSGMGTCTATICPAGNDICQLRLDFDQFQIAGPSTVSLSVTKLVNGNPSAAANAIPNAILGQCITDQFQVTSGSGVTPPVICGINTNQHVFVDADADCNMLMFQLGQGAVSRSFQIRVTQYACTSPNLAPSGCTQYFTSDTGTGMVQSFNFGNGHLADQDQVMCVRRNQNSCRICWTTVLDTDFDVSGTASSGMGASTTARFCCGSNTVGTAVGNAGGYDCLSLPFAESKMGNMNVQSRFCGRNAGLSSSAMSSLTVCSRASPFRVAFRSNAFEVSDMTLPNTEAKNVDKGVRLVYFQDSVMC
ncbi:uncharacterized protein LOC131892026 [Tigriopus californicus]|uniref:uncharacterized protein LOC131892026 n=1 Tax=Tigriopus californicus TaxID=6832 RepID=UPI0027DA1EFE|nr:uncharacterized protein LOC131892026 [Tigriopus californicus]